MEVECNFAELVDFLNSERICSLEAAWILEDISLISDSFDCISFTSIPLQCNHAALTLASDVKEKKEVVDINKVYYRFSWRSALLSPMIENHLKNKLLKSL